VRSLDIIRIAVLAALALYYALIGEAPHVIFLWFGVVDAVTVVVFAAFLWIVRRMTPPVEA
jgi:hypothetical protein